MKRCPDCGTENNPYIKACVACGIELPSAMEVAKAQAAAMTPEAIFVGDNFDYYDRKWERMASSDGYQSWNWAAFFLGPYWLLYRRLYLYFSIYIAVIAGLVVIEVQFAIDDAVSGVMHIAVAVVLGLLGNYWYKLHMQRKLAAITDGGTPEQVRAALVRAGGTSPVGPSLLLIAMALLIYFTLAYQE